MVSGKLVIIGFAAIHRLRRQCIDLKFSLRDFAARLIHHPRPVTLRHPNDRVPFEDVGAFSPYAKGFFHVDPLGERMFDNDFGCGWSGKINVC